MAEKLPRSVLVAEAYKLATDELAKRLSTTEAALAESRGEVEALRQEKADRHELWMERRDAFTDCLSDYERLRGYVARRHNDMDADPRTVAH